VQIVAAGPAGTDVYVDDAFVSLSSNLIGNPGFETDATGWDGWGATISATNTKAHTGTKSGLVTNRTASYQGAVYDLTSVVTAGQTYNASIWVQLSVSGSAAFSAKVICDGATTYPWIGGATANNSTWTQLSGSFTIPTCTTLSAVQIVAAGPAGTDVYVDDAFVSIPP
jgi:hypothetical protein